MYVNSVPGLVALAQAGILEVHPWNSRVAALEQPDQVIFDLDPDEALPFSRVAAAPSMKRCAPAVSCFTAPTGFRPTSCSRLSSIIPSRAAIF